MSAAPDGEPGDRGLQMPVLGLPAMPGNLGDLASFRLPSLAALQQLPLTLGAAGRLPNPFGGWAGEAEAAARDDRRRAMMHMYAEEDRLKGSATRTALHEALPHGSATTDSAGGIGEGPRSLLQATRGVDRSLNSTPQTMATPRSELEPKSDASPQDDVPNTAHRTAFSCRSRKATLEPAHAEREASEEEEDDGATLSARSSISSLWTPRQAEPTPGDTNEASAPGVSLGSLSDLQSRMGLNMPEFSAPKMQMDVLTAANLPSVDRVKDSLFHQPASLLRNAFASQPTQARTNAPSVSPSNRKSSLPATANATATAGPGVEDSGAKGSATARAPYAWFHGVLETGRARPALEPHYTYRGTSRHPDSRQRDWHVSSLQALDSEQSPVPAVLLPRMPDDKTYDKLDEAGWKFISVLQTPRETEWSPDVQIIDAAARAGASAPPINSDTGLPPVDAFFNGAVPARTKAAGLANSPGPDSNATHSDVFLDRSSCDISPRVTPRATSQPDILTVEISSPTRPPTITIPLPAQASHDPEPQCLQARHVNGDPAWKPALACDPANTVVSPRGRMAWEAPRPSARALREKQLVSRNVLTSKQRGLEKMVASEGGPGWGEEERTNRGLKHVRGDVESTARAEEVARQMREQREAAEHERNRERRERAEAEQVAARMREAREARELKEAEDQRKKREEDEKEADIARERMQRERETEERDKDEARRKRDLEGAEEPRLPGQRGTETQVTPAVTKNADAREEPPPERAGAAVDDGTPRRESSEMHMKAIDSDRMKREAEIAAARAQAQTRLSRKADDETELVRALAERRRKAVAAEIERQQEEEAREERDREREKELQREQRERTQKERAERERNRRQEAEQQDRGPREEERVKEKEAAEMDVKRREKQGQEQERTGKTDDDLRRQARGKEEMRRVEMAVAKKGCQDTVCTRASTTHALDLPCVKTKYVLDVVVYTQAKQRDLESDEAKLAAFAEKRRKAEAASTWIIEKGMTSSDATVDEGWQRFRPDGQQERHHIRQDRVDKADKHAAGLKQDTDARAVQTVTDHQPRTMSSSSEGGISGREGPGGNMVDEDGNLLPVERRQEGSRNFAGKFWQRQERERKEQEERTREEYERLASNKSQGMRLHIFMDPGDGKHVHNLRAANECIVTERAGLEKGRDRRQEAAVNISGFEAEGLRKLEEVRKRREAAEAEESRLAAEAARSILVEQARIAAEIEQAQLQTRLEEEAEQARRVADADQKREAIAKEGDQQVMTARQAMARGDFATAKAAMRSAADCFTQAGGDRQSCVDAVLKDIVTAEQQQVAYMKAGNTALALARKLLSETTAPTADEAVRTVTAASSACASAREEFARVFAAEDKNRELDLLVSKIAAAHEEAKRRKTHALAGDAAISCARTELANSDLESSRAARQRAVTEYALAEEDHRAELMELEHAIRDLAEKRELQERLERVEAQRKKREEEIKAREDEAREKRERAEAEAERNRLAAEADKRRLAEEAERARLAEEARDAEEKKIAAQRDKQERAMKARAEAEKSEQHRAEKEHAEQQHKGEDEQEPTKRDRNSPQYIPGEVQGLSKGAGNHAQTHASSGVDAAKGRGYLGIEVTKTLPHAVLAVRDLLDRNSVRQGAAGYSNEEVKPGDRFIAIDGRAAEKVSIEMLHDMLRGPLHSEVELTLARGSNHQPFTVRVMRHGFHEYDSSATASLAVSAPIHTAPADSLASMPQDRDVDNERAQRARERRLRFLLESGVSPSFLEDSQSPSQMSSPLTSVQSSPRTALASPPLTSAAVEIDRAQRARERRNQFGGDDLAQLQATLSASASGLSGSSYSSRPYSASVTSSPRTTSGYHSPVLVHGEHSNRSISGASPRVSGHLSISEQTTISGQLSAMRRAAGSSSGALPRSLQYSTARRPPSGSNSGASSPWGSGGTATPHSRK